MKIRMKVIMMKCHLRIKIMSESLYILYRAKKEIAMQFSLKINVRKAKKLSIINPRKLRQEDDKSTRIN